MTGLRLPAASARHRPGSWRLRDNTGPRWWRRCLAAAVVGLLIPLTAHAEVSVEVRGIEGALQDNVRNYVGEPSSDEPLAVRRFAGGLDRRVREALQALGHYDPEIDVSTRRDGDDWQVIIDVAPGKPVMVIERGATAYAVDVRDLVGHELRAEETDRELQSSLRAF